MFSNKRRENLGKKKHYKNSESLTKNVIQQDVGKLSLRQAGDEAANRDSGSSL